MLILPSGYSGRTIKRTCPPNFKSTLLGEYPDLSYPDRRLPTRLDVHKTLTLTTMQALDNVSARMEHHRKVV
jgi:hypothetical protein